MLPKIAFVVAMTLLAGAAQGLTTIEKPPDVGPFWNPLSPNGGTYVYADCFIAPAGVDIHVQSLGTWLLDQAPGGEPGGGLTREGFVPQGGAPPTVRFEIWGDTPPGPDAGDVLATTGSIQPAPAGLDFVEAPVLPGATALTPGTRYWFAATVVGEAGDGSYQTGGHTQNSVYVDNCTFWYSNDPAGIFFDGQNLTPEMAFSVTLDDVPVPVELMSFEVE
jgi:hypothetical protein